MFLECSLSALLLGVVGFHILYRISRWFQFYVDYFSYNIAMVLLGCLAVLVALLRPGNVNNFYRTSRLLYWISSKYFRVRVEAKGLENLPENKNCIIVSNHQSSLDMFPILRICPPYTTFIAKRELLFAPFFGVAAWLTGTVFIKRGDSRSARGALDGAVQRITSERMNLWVFPEGTRSQTGTIKPFKKGAFHVAQQSKVPIVPVVLSNYIPVFNKKNKTFTPGIIKVTILPEVPTDGLTPSDVTSLTERVWHDMLKVFHEGQPIPNNMDQDKPKEQ
ncbi:1-acyl-sn-glycerol-3-phosphate acyltransferase alpha [Nematostella vectensis]|uniref:1-acyl-sn-glycerol-3-phosphate acyltransferase alpha n=1 Tax=Nematostella vectensis TaxID=45351 RepID=UPI00207782C9|nr:1-acyl-sn-glycerol-3-phosphate acyltransferase alpha [Nematostella vectensis]